MNEDRNQSNNCDAAPRQPDIGILTQYTNVDPSVRVPTQGNE